MIEMLNDINEGIKEKLDNAVKRDETIKMILWIVIYLLWTIFVHATVWLGFVLMMTLTLSSFGPKEVEESD